ncbi:MAG: hypothetical protein U9N60_09920 [Thermodesulfobacteriota bacterium]|nr:hypothetical protein [Thermodesulfobacteriota bacterium]
MRFDYSCKRFCGAFAVIIALFTHVVSCAPVMTEKPQDETYSLNSIAVLPVDISIDRDRDSSYSTASRLETGAAVLDGIISEYFNDIDTTTIKIISRNKREALAGDHIGDRLSLALAVGRQVRTDAVLMCTVYRYVEREGKKSAVVHPASVAFNYRLVLTETGRTICSGVFDETQQALFDNLFSLSVAIKRGFEWITAKALAREGVTGKFKECPYLNPRTDNPQGTGRK